MSVSHEHVNPGYREQINRSGRSELVLAPSEFARLIRVLERREKRRNRRVRSISHVEASP